MKNKLLILILLCLSLLSFSQQEQQYTLYMVNPFTINPALGGTEDFIDIKMGYRTQWVGFESAPKTYYLTGHGTLGKEFNGSSYHRKTERKSWHGIGGFVYRDETGPFSRSGFSFQYAYNLPLSRGVRFSLGSFFGAKNYTYDISSLRREEFIDDAIPLTRISRTIPDLSVGIWIYADNWYLGGSGFQLLQNKIGVKDLLLSKNNRLLSHYFINGGVKLPINETFILVPSFGIKTIFPLNASIDVSMKLDYKDFVCGGVSLRSGDSFSVFIGTLVKSIEISYAYDITLSSIRNDSAGSHEVVVGVRINHPTHVLCPSKFW